MRALHAYREPGLKKSAQGCCCSAAIVAPVLPHGALMPHVCDRHTSPVGLYLLSCEILVGTQQVKIPPGLHQLPKPFPPITTSFLIMHAELSFDD